MLILWKAAQRIEQKVDSTIEEIDDLKEEGYRKNARTKDVLKSEKR